MKTNDDRQHLTQAQPRLAVTLFWGRCQQVLLPARLKELAMCWFSVNRSFALRF
jgi:hypothetical protein